MLKDYEDFIKSVSDFALNNLKQSICIESPAKACLFCEMTPLNNEWFEFKKPIFAKTALLYCINKIGIIGLF